MIDPNRFLFRRARRGYPVLILAATVILALNTSFGLPLKPEVDLVRLSDFSADFVFDLKYATTDNFMGKAVYPVAVALLRPVAAKNLAKAQAEFKKSGYRIKIYDAYRPLHIQKKLWALKPDPRYVANPATGSNHNRGAAVDITLVDSLGRELKMPTDFDDFTAAAANPYIGSDSVIERNTRLLTAVMERNGFVRYPAEWWHFHAAGAGNYPLLDHRLEDYLTTNTRK